MEADKFSQLPCNGPVSSVYTPYQRDGAFRYTSNFGGDPNYIRSQLRAVNFKGSVGANNVAHVGHEEWVGRIAAYTSEVTDEDFVQATAMWEVLKRDGSDEHFVYNVTQHLKGAIPELQQGALGEFYSSDWDRSISTNDALDMFSQVDKDLVRRMVEALQNKYKN